MKIPSLLVDVFLDEDSGIGRISYQHDIELSAAGLLARLACISEREFRPDLALSLPEVMGGDDGKFRHSGLRAHVPDARD